MKIIRNKRPALMAVVALFLSAGLLPHQAHAAQDKSSPSEMYTVKIVPEAPGDSLSAMALRACGKSSLWRTIADANGITKAPYWVYLGKAITIPCATFAFASANKQSLIVRAKPIVITKVKPKEITAQKAVTLPTILTSAIPPTVLAAPVAHHSEWHRVRQRFKSIEWKAWWFSVPAGLLAIVTVFYFFGSLIVRGIFIFYRAIAGKVCKFWQRIWSKTELRYNRYNQLVKVRKRTAPIAKVAKEAVPSMPTPKPVTHCETLPDPRFPGDHRALICGLDETIYKPIALEATESVIEEPQRVIVMSPRHSVVA